MTSSTTPVTITARHLVVDLEGTTSAAGFILGDLYDYARPRLAPYLDAHADESLVVEARAQIVADAGLPADADTATIVGVLHGWMADDVKATPLKTLQGQIWADGFARDEISSHFFDDVIPKLRAWHEAGVVISVFSSGSVASQVPWFRHSPGGDLTPIIHDYFDTVKAGSKKEPASYDAIATALDASAQSIVFFTDHPDEVTAARAAGWQVVAFSRPGEPWFGADFGDTPVVGSFDEVEVAVPGQAPGVSAGDAPRTNILGATASGTVTVPLDEAGAILAAEAARFTAMGWMRGTSGNLSVTLARDPLRLAVTGSGLDKGELTPADFVVVDELGESVVGEGGSELTPSAEAGLHARIARVTGAGAVVHVHAFAAVVAAHHWPNGVALHDLEMLKALGHRAHDETVVVPVIQNTQDMVELGDAFEAAYLPATDETAEVPVVLVANHGLYAWGATMHEARWHAEAIEWLLRFRVETR